MKFESVVDLLIRDLPIMIELISFVVGFIIIAFFLPIAAIISQLTG